MSRPLILSIFPGIDLLGLAFEMEWPEACIVRGPDPIFNSLSDIRSFHPPAGVFDGVIDGPPCQPFSRLVHMVRANGYEPRHPNLIPEFERIIQESRPNWFVMEEVPDAPVPHVETYKVREYVLNNRWFGSDQERVRRVSFGTHDGRGLCLEVVPLESIDWEPAVSSHANPTPVKLTRGGKAKSTARRTARTVGEMLELQGFPRNLLEECPLTESGKRLVVGNGVPMDMGRAIARAVKRAFYETGVTDVAP